MNFKTRSKMVNVINNKICDVSNGIFNDENWFGKILITDALNSIDGIEYTIIHSKYHNEGNIPVRKKWMYKVTDGKHIAYVHIIASGCGSVNAPLEKYDICAYCS